MAEFRINFIQSRPKHQLYLLALLDEIAAGEDEMRTLYGKGASSVVSWQEADLICS
jgi:hypothetical protein